MILPIDFINDIEQELGKTEADKLVAVLTGNETVTSIRLNSGKGRELSVKDGTTPVEWCESGYYLNERPLFTFDPLFHAGVYYVQEASSMFLCQALQQYVHAPVRMLDLCAAPGGKSTLALQFLPKGSLLVSNEIDRQRSRILMENIIKWGYLNVLVTNNAPKDFAHFTNYFDVILTDVPCSGEGMFRKDAQAVSEWSEKNVTMCTERQRSILKDCWNSLKPGGLLIYSTCTFNLHEDEENVHWIVENLGAESLPLKMENEWNITGNLAGYPEHTYHFFPHKNPGEGFFLAVLRKTGSDSAAFQMEFGVSLRNKKFKNKSKNGDMKNRGNYPKLPDEIKKWILSSEHFIFKEKEDELIAVPLSLEEDFKQLTKELYPLQEGITIAVKKGKNWVPAQSLAMSQQLNSSVFYSYDASLKDAWAYLRGEALALPENVPIGFVLITYKHHPLGFVKNIGNRSNNLYPQNWKIRSSHLPKPEDAISIFQRSLD